MQAPEKILSKTSTNKYVVSRKLGQGSFGMVFVGENLKTSEKVIIKVIFKNKIVTPEQVIRVRKEIEIPQYLTKENDVQKCHKNVVCVTDSVETPSLIYIISEYVQGAIELASWPPNNFRADTEERQITILNILHQLADGLNFMHSQGVAHRDIKPQNIIMKGNIPMYIDFDMACIFDDKEFPCDKFVGSPLYASPEVWRHVSNLDYFKSDIYSLGVVFYFITNPGRLPYMGRDPIDIGHKVVNLDPVPSRSIITGVNEIIMSMIDKDPQKRPMAQEISEKIQKLIKSYVFKPSK